MVILKKLFISISFVVWLSGNLQGQSCETALEDALESFAWQHYSHVIATLVQCPPLHWSERSAKIVAFELLALAYSKLDSLTSAVTAINHLLDLQPGYAPTAPRYSAAYLKLVDMARSERQQREGRSVFRNKWFWLGGAAATTAVVLLMSQQTNPVETLPVAPDPPGSR